MVVSTVSKQQQNAKYRSPPATTRTVVLKPSNTNIRGTTASIRQSKALERQSSGPRPRSQKKMASAASSTGKSQEYRSDSSFCKSHQHHLHRQSSSSLGASESSPSLQIHEAAMPPPLPIALPLTETNLQEYDISKKRRRNFNMQTYIQFFMGAPRSQKAVIIFLALWFLSSTARMIRYGYRKLQGEQLPPPQHLDFLVAGFPKSGTTTLLATLRQHPEIAMDSQENCQVARPIQQDDVNLKRLNRYLFALKRDIADDRKFKSSLQRLGASSSSSSSAIASTQPALEADQLKAGIKCPDAVKNFKAIHRLSQHSPDCRFVIGVRHPITFVQSFYNYRLLEAHIKNRPDKPSLFEIWKSNLNWWDVSKDAPRYEMFLSQFGKTSVSLGQLKEWFVERPMLAVKPNKFKIFLYSIEQIEDPVESKLLRTDLQRFLGLTQPIDEFGHENRIASNANQITKHIDICSPEYSHIRKDIINNAPATVAWMHEFLESPDVIVSDRQKLLKSINSWSTDPCEDATIMAI